MKLILPKAIEERIHAYTMSVPSEIAGMGKVRVEGTDTIIVEEVAIYEQEVTGATADLSTKALAKFQSELVKAGGSPKHWKLWWHSHDNMAAFFSGRDTATIDGQSESDWLVSLVVNKKRERQARLDLYRPFRMYLDNLEIEMQGEAYTVPADIAKEVAEKVKRSVPSYTGIGYGVPYEGIDDGISLHRYCPLHTQGIKECYRPYGEAVGISANCTTKAFKKRYGANPFMPSVRYQDPDYGKDQLISITKTLQAQINEYENRGMGDSNECLELSAELADTYYQLVEAETDPDIAEQIRAEARLLENNIYGIDSTLPL